MKNNNARVGFTIQKIICDKFKIIPDSEATIRQFEASYEDEISLELSEIVDEIFDLLKLFPVKCSTLQRDKTGKLPGYNFILNDNSTLSIRTNMNGTKISPRNVGQAGYLKLNEFFGDIYGKEIKNKNDIKHLIIDKIDKVLPIFFDNFFDADYIIWIYNEDRKYKSHLISGDLEVDIEYKKELFSFTRNYDEWTESTTLKYTNISIAEIQIHKERTFKFRFIMNNIIPLLIKKKTNNETLGITAEKAICDVFSIEYPSSFLNRYSPNMQNELTPIIIDAFKNIPKAIKSTGSTRGERGKNSKCPYDFILEGEKKLSVKSNTGKMVCPPEVGQPGAETCYLYFNHLTDEKYINGDIFKKMVFDHITEMLPIYLLHMFDSDFLLWLYRKKETFEYKIIEKDYASKMVWNFEEISFTKSSVDDWNESNTLKYKNISIGEFQVHKNRDCFKFRFNLENLIKIIEEEKQKNSSFY